MLLGGANLVAVDVLLRLVALGGRHVEAELDVETELLGDVAGSLVDDFEGGGVVDGRRPRTLVAFRGGLAALFEQFAHAFVDGGVREHCLSNARRADGGREELLNRGRVGGVFAATDDVPERHGEVSTAEGAAEMLVQRRTEYVRGGLRGRHADGDRAVRPDVGEVLRTVGSVQRGVDATLVASELPAFEARRDVFARCRNRLLDGEFDGLVFARASAGWRRRTAEPAVLGHDLGFHGLVAAGVQNRPESDGLDARHLSCPSGQ